MKNTQTDKTASAPETRKPILDALLNASESFADERTVKSQHSPLPDWIGQGKIDGALVDQNGIYVSPSKTIAVLHRIAKQRDEARYHAEALAEALRECLKCHSENAPIHKVITEALARWEGAK